MKGIIFICLLSCAATVPKAFADFDAGNIALPTYSELEHRMLREQKELNDPTMGLGESYHGLSEQNKHALSKQHDMQRWVYGHRAAILALVSGKTDQFRNLMLSLMEKQPPKTDPYFAARITELMHLVVEADVQISDESLQSLFDDAFSALNEDVLIPQQYSLFRASYWYLRGNTEPLVQLAESSPEAGSPEELFVCGYVSLLAGKSTQSSKQLSKAISCFESLVDVFKSPSELTSTADISFREEVKRQTQRLDLGRASMHLADAMKTLAQSTSEKEERRILINKAAKVAAYARSNIELIDNPLMWGQSHRITSEVLDLLFVVESAEMSGDRLDDLASRRDRAFELSVMYR